MNSENKVFHFNYNGLSGTSISLILIILMVVSNIIPPVTFSEMIIDWSQILIINYIRAAIGILAGIFVPGYSLFNMIFSNNQLSKRFKIEPIYIKLVFYPVISLTFLGALTLILDGFGLERQYFSSVIQITTVVLFLANLIFQKYTSRKIRFIKNTKVEISKHTLFILIFASIIVFIAVVLHIHAKYLLIEDDYYSLQYAQLIGYPKTYSYNSYTVYWSYIAYSLSSISGIPIVNTSVMLVPLIYLSLLSVYLLIKSFLAGKNAKYAILASILVVTFANLFEIFQDSSDFHKVSRLTLDSLFLFRYKGFSIILVIISLALFINLTKNEVSKNIKEIIKTYEFKLILLSAFFLIQSFMIYFLPLIPAALLILCFLLLSKQKKSFFRYYIIFLCSSLFFFTIFDISSDFFFSSLSISRLNYFFKILILFPNISYSQLILLSPILFYSFLGFFLLINFLLFNFFNRYSSIRKKSKIKRNLNHKFIFVLLELIFLSFLFLEIILNLIFTKRGLNYFTFFLHLFYYRIGFIGIIGILLSYYGHKMIRETFFILLVWFLLIYFISIFSFLSQWIQSPVSMPILTESYHSASYWFDRTIYYVNIPASIFASIGLIKVIRRFDKKSLRLKYAKNLKIFFKMSCIGGLLFFAMVNTVMFGIEINNFKGNLDDNQAQVSGWVSENLPKDSNIMVDDNTIYYYLRAVSLTKTYFINKEINKAIDNYAFGEIKNTSDSNCNIILNNNFIGRENIIELDDYNDNGRINLTIDTINLQESGSIIFSINLSNANNSFWINFSSSNNYVGISIYFGSSGLYFYNETGYQKVSDVISNVWYDIVLNFECTDGFYNGLKKYEWSLTINNTNDLIYHFWENASNFRYINFLTANLEHNYSIFIDNFKISGITDFKLENWLFNYLIIFDHLIDKKIYYLIISEAPTVYKEEAEEFIEIDEVLIPKFFINKLYEYKSIKIFTRPG